MNSSMRQKSFRTQFINPGQASKGDNLRNSSFVKDLSEIEKNILELKIYQPYFISNSTILEYQKKNKNETEKLSIMDILETHFLRKKVACKLFF
jgi:hypothetical protein